MYNKAIDVLKIFKEHGFDAYIVGGYPRDKILGIDTNDIDICTNAKPKEIMEIFDTDGVNDIKYGYVKVIYKGFLFDVTTFRKDIKYENNRRPIKIKYINDLKKDLLRRDFTINTMCIDSDEKLIDLLDAKKDIENKTIKIVGSPRHKLKEDSLRILRAIRFAANLDIDIDNKTMYYMKKYSYLIKYLSSFRKKEELDKIFSSKNKEKGVKLLIDLGIDKYLGLDNLNEIVLCNDIIGVWSQIRFTTDYPFSKVEKDNITKIKDMLREGINNFTIYKYGLYTAKVVSSIMHIDYKQISDIYRKLPIYSRKEIAISGREIIELLGMEYAKEVKKIVNDIEIQIIDGNIINEHDALVKYVMENYGG